MTGVSAIMAPMIRRSCAAALIFMAATASAATQGGRMPVPLPLFPPNNWWNTDVSAAPVDPGSANFINFIGAGDGLHPDFGGDAGDGNVYGMPFLLVDGAQAKKVVDFVSYPAESDGVGLAFYPVPDEAVTMNGWVEGGQPGNVDERDEGDRHILIVDTTNNDLYELYNVWHNGTQWEAGSGAFFDMDTNGRRPEGWTSADAAGLAILPGLVRYDEVNDEGEIRHAFRMTVRATNGHVYPASHTAGSTAGALPMGARLRLKAGKDIAGYTTDVQKIFRAFKTYGLIVADNGSDMYISGAYDTRWNNDVLNPAFASLKASDFEVIQLGWQPTISLVVTLPGAAGAGDPAGITVTAYDQNYNLATSYTGTVAFTSTDGAATLPLDYTFTAGDSGSHTFPSGLILRTAGQQVVTATDVAAATITGSRSVVVGPPTPANLIATAASSTSIDLTWNPSNGATQYEVLRRAAGGDYTPLTTTTSASFTDSAVTPNAAYAYKVRALDSSSRPSPLSAPDIAIARLFTDDPAVAGMTPIKAVHVTELREAINAMLATAGITAEIFTDPGLAAGMPLKAVHIHEARTALAQARSALGVPAITLTDPSIEAGATTAKAAHLQELRNGAK